jgi:hypothetical protein
MSEKAKYPCMRYHPVHAPEGKRIETAVEEAKLGEGWVDTPAKFPKDAPPPKPPEAAKACANCKELEARIESLTATFDTNYGKLEARLRELEAQNAELSAANVELSKRPAVSAKPSGKKPPAAATEPEAQTT